MDASPMILRTFMDETGVHEDAEMVAVSGYIAKAKTWRAWTKDWNLHKRKVPAGRRPIKVYHATDCANYRGEFDGWTKEERDPYVAQLLPVIPTHQMAGIVIGINLVELDKVFRQYAELVEMFGTPYTACFQWAISIIVDIATQHGSGQRMAFVHEVNDYKGECLKAFEYIDTYLNPRKIPMTMSFGSKEQYSPLQAADVLAYEGGKFLKNIDKPRRAWTALDPDKTRLIVRRYGEDNMTEMVKLLTDFRKSLLASGWDGMVVI